MLQLIYYSVNLEFEIHQRNGYYNLQCPSDTRVLDKVPKGPDGHNSLRKNFTSKIVTYFQALRSPNNDLILTLTVGSLVPFHHSSIAR